MEKIFICQQCHAELGEDEVDGILGHAVPDYDEDGDVDGCNQCGPCEMNRDWALARIKSLKDCAAKMQKRILELAENEAVTSANYNGAVARIAELEAEIVERRKDYSACIRDQDARIAELEAQLAAAQEREVAYRNALMDAAKDYDQAGMGNCCQRVLDELNRIINAAEADHANN